LAGVQVRVYHVARMMGVLSRRVGRGRLVLAVASSGFVLGLGVLGPTTALAAPLSLSPVAEIDGTNQLWHVSCPSTSLCVAADGAGNVLTTTQPAGGTWSAPADIDGANPIFGLSCVSASLCVAVDGAGNVLTSKKPAGGADAWSAAADIDASGSLVAVSCPSSSLCVAVDDDGDVLTSTNPAGGTSAWSSPVDIDGSTSFTDVVCPSTALCLAIDQAGDVLTSTNPTGGAGAWSPPVDIDGSTPLNAISCAGSFCAAVDDAGNTVESMNPAGGTSAWTVNNIDGSNSLTAISCIQQYCTAVDGTGAVFAKAPPPWGTSNDGWGSLGSASRALFGVSCPATGLCVAVGDQGVELASTGSMLAVAFAGSGTGTVSDSTASFSCMSACSAWYASGAAVSVDAAPAVGSTFAGWGGTCPGTVNLNSCEITMTTNQAVSATFTKIPLSQLPLVHLTILRGGTGSGTVLSNRAPRRARGRAA